MDLDTTPATVESLEKLAALLASLQEAPFSYSLHYQHLALAASTGGADELTSAREMLVSCLAVADDVWLPYLESKTKAMADLFELVQDESAASVLEDIDGTLLSASEATEELFERAERDYLSIPVLQAHLQFVFDQHTRATLLPPSNSTKFAQAYSTENVSSQAKSIVDKGERHIRLSHILWDSWMEWGEAQLENVTGSAKNERSLALASEYSKRMTLPHLNHGNTFTNYSTFVTTHLSDQDYEQVMRTAIQDKQRQQAIRLSDERDRHESSLNSLQEWFSYVNWESSPKPGHIIKKVRGRQAKPADVAPDPALVIPLYERAIAEAANCRGKALSREGEGTPLAEAEAWLGVFWVGLCDFLQSQKEAARDKDTELNVSQRALRSAPTNAEVVAAFIRSLDTYGSNDLEEIEEDWANIENAFGQVLGSGLLDPGGVTTVTLAAGGYCNRRLKQDNDEAGSEIFERLRRVLHAGIEATRSKEGGDPSLKLEKFLSKAYVSQGFEEQAIEVWTEAIKFYKKSYYVWTSYIEFLIHVVSSPQQARAAFENATNPSRNIDYPQAIWDAWISFEEYYGSVAELCYARTRVRKLTNAQQRKDAEAAQRYDHNGAQNTHQSAHMTSDDVPTTSVTAAPTVHATVGDPSSSMDVDDAVDQLISSAIPSTSQAQAVARQKRKAEDEGDVASTASGSGLHQAKKAKPVTEAPLKRDRENSTVLVTGLLEDNDDASLRRLFRDCGSVREVVIKKIATDMGEELVASVEFMDSESVPAALTKDKKRIEGNEVAVHLAWRSTLYVTNFPQNTDDAAIREMFGQYGTLWDVRWPSKKFKETRRFCYVQFISPTTAEASLALNGKTFDSSDMAMTVALSNPQRKKERTDVHNYKREVHVSNLPRGVTKKELQTLFSQCGPVRDVRLLTDGGGRPLGTAFVEYEDEASALSSVSSLHNAELKKRNITVTSASAKSRRVEPTKAAVNSKTLWLSNLPSGAQEGLLQQVVEKVGSGVKSVCIFQEESIASVLFEAESDAGKFLLQQSELQFMDASLPVSETKPVVKREQAKSKAAAPASSAPQGFIPRATNRPRPGLGVKKKALIKIPDSSVGAGAPPAASTSAVSSAPSGANGASDGKGGSSGKTQDAFRAMLGKQ